MGREKQLNIRVTENFLNKLNKVSNKYDVPAAVLVRVGISMLFKEMGNPDFDLYREIGAMLREEKIKTRRLLNERQKREKNKR